MLSTTSKISTSSKLKSFIKQSKEEILVRIPGSEQFISLSSEEDYWKLIDEYALHEIGMNDILEKSKTSFPSAIDKALAVDTITAVSFSKKTLQRDFNITSPRNTGNLLVFTIAHYNPIISYTVNFFIYMSYRTVSQRFGYRYPRN